MKKFLFLLIPASLSAGCSTFSVDFLYWYANECNLAYATELEVFSSDLLLPKRVKNLDGGWDPGVRLGMSWESTCKGWDIGAEWTYYRNEQKKSASVPDTLGYFPDPGEKLLQPVWLSSLASGGAFNLYNKIGAKWDFIYNRLDIELGYRACLSPCFSLRPFAGLVGLWTETDFKVKHFPKVGEYDQTVVSNSGTFKTNNNNWSIGLLAGFEPEWFFTNCFSLFGKLGVALSWGEFRDNQKEKASFSQVPGNSGFIEYKTRDHFDCMQPILDMALGLRFSWRCISLDVGWENHILFDHNTRVSAAGSVRTTGSGGETILFPNLFWNSFDLGLGGLVISGKLHF